MTLQTVSAEIISCPGRLGDVAYSALQINIAGFDSPYVLTLALPAVGFRALSQQVDPVALYDALARAINAAHLQLETRPDQGAAAAA
jgi:hypothetical protein